ncbi:TPA: DUF551 domain-containing protein [Klebsiella pneumoniae]|nr:DUF551 domain-containing protein [Klebsiella pneumoniae]
MINRDKLEHILEYARQQRHIGQSCKVPPEDMVEIMERLLNAGNSPVIPDGYVMVPKEPTDEMIHAGHLYFQRSMEMCDDFTPSGMFNSMLAAAPQSPGSEPATVPGKWIPVSERMPESNGVYFGWDGKRVLEVNCFFGGFSANQFIHGEITHWMPLPAAPQEVNHG